MKIRNDFVTNSSSSSFIITNKNKNDLTLKDFIIENPQLIEDFKNCYCWYNDDSDYTQEKLIKSAEREKITLPGNTRDIYTFGDEDGTLVGYVLDYILRNGGESENFKWEYSHSNR